MEAKCQELTVVTVVIHQDDFLEQVGWGVIHHAVHRAQDDGQSLVDKYEHHRDLGQVLRVAHLLAPAQRKDIIKTPAATGGKAG